MNKHKILLVEDDTEISEMLTNYLTTENYEITCAADGQEACNQFDHSTFSLVLLDLMIPKISGMDVMQHIRKSSVVPVIILSAKDTESDKTLGLGLGADDYITKPFSVAEVLARIKANIRRTTQYDNASIVAPVLLTAGDLVMNLSDYTITKKGDNIELTAKEFDILKLLLQNPKKVYAKAPRRARQYLLGHRRRYTRPLTVTPYAGCPVIRGLSLSNLRSPFRRLPPLTFPAP